MSTPDDVRAELAFLRARSEELRLEIQACESALGTPLNEGSVGWLLADIVAALRRSGQEALAVKYAVACDRFQAARKIHAAHLDRGDVNGAACEAACEAMTDACDAFERVHADVSAWLESDRGRS